MRRSPSLLSPALLIGGALLLNAPFVASCSAVRPSAGGGETTPMKDRIIRVEQIALPDSYVIEPVATGLTFPTGVTFDEQNRPYVTEAGYSYGEVFATPKLLRVEPGGKLSVVLTGKNPPWTGVSYHDGAFFLSEGGVTEGGRILRATPDGKTTALVEGLPSGDHHTMGLWWGLMDSSISARGRRRTPASWARITTSSAGSSGRPSCTTCRAKT
jgi:hypothetical protein